MCEYSLKTEKGKWAEVPEIHPKDVKRKRSKMKYLITKTEL